MRDTVGIVRRPDGMRRLHDIVLTAIGAEIIADTSSGFRLRPQARLFLASDHHLRLRRLRLHPHPRLQQHARQYGAGS